MTVGGYGYIWIKRKPITYQMGLWHGYFYLIILFIGYTEQKNSTIKHSDRRGKALKISKKPCSDPSGRRGICTFKWDCINHNGTLMGTCMDGFIFGTCCQYDYDPLLHEEPLKDFSTYDNDNKIFEHNIYVPPTTKRTTTTTTTSAPSRFAVSSTRIPTTFSRPFPTTRLPIVTSKPPVITTTQTTTTTLRPGQLVTWSSVGPTRRPQPAPPRPILLSPFPFRPGISYAPSSQSGWPVGIAFPVDPFQLNRPILAYRPRPQQSNPIAQSSNVFNNTVLQNATSSFTILNGADASAQRNNSLNLKELTTISVPIPQWSTAGSTRSSSTRLPSTAGGSISLIQTTTKPTLDSSLNSSTTVLAAPKTTKRPNLDYRRDCGVRALGPKGRIVGGQSSHFGRWPWQVLVKEAAWLGLYQKNKCGGVLVSARHAITAGHCQPGRFLSSLVVILGEHDILTDYEPMKPEIRRVKRMIVHRGYNPQNFDNDIAVLELDVPIAFKPHISPICLPEPDEDFTGKMAYVTGWGKTSHGGAIPNLLQEVQVPIMSNSRCIGMFKEAGHNKLIKNTFLCAGYKDGGKDSCEGDSGGPLMVERESGQWVLAGTVSHGIRCADPNLPGVYMRVAAYRPWIDKIVRT